MNKILTLPFRMLLIVALPKPGSSWTQDTYKIIMFVHYQTEWRATGSGVDFKCGTLDVCPDAVKADIASAHEIGHTFQYIVACDFSDPRNHGWQWGFEESTTGLCALASSGVMSA